MYLVLSDRIAMKKKKMSILAQGNKYGVLKQVSLETQNVW